MRDARSAEDAAFAVNVRGPFLVTAAFLPMLARASEHAGREIASVVNISSVRIESRHETERADLRPDPVDTHGPLQLQHEVSQREPYHR